MDGDELRADEGVGEGSWQAEMAWGLGVDERPADGLQSMTEAPKAAMRERRCAGWREEYARRNSPTGRAEIAGKIRVSCQAALSGRERPWLAAGPRRD